MRKNVLVVNRIDNKIKEKLTNEFDVSFLSTKGKTKEEIYRHISQIHGIIGSGLRIDESLLKEAGNLEIVCNLSVGYNNFDIDAMISHGVMGTNTPDVLTDTVADLIFGLILSAARRIPELDNFVKRGLWTDDLYEEFYGLNVHRKTIGIIGMGRIGEAIAKRAHYGFDMNVIYNARTKKDFVEQEYAAKYRSLDALLKESDFVVLMTPLTKETQGLLTIREFKLMKDSAIFINGSRGGTIVEEDLIKALRLKEIAAAALDVFSVEPVNPENPLLQLPNVVTTPHIGSATATTEYNMAELAYKNLVQGLRGKKPCTLVSEKMWLS